eukprot:TRINITY_DN17096_c0_g1_i1.p2 TRINITY_DN17096_c0_g1~~TRINITY_DN17096_c0_g1_i1.p2  ORF type:complete len:149 (-),score=10.38 TRINITY_DN17096_c0_g1_i1:27-473(-)
MLAVLVLPCALEHWYPYHWNLIDKLSHWPRQSDPFSPSSKSLGTAYVPPETVRFRHSALSSWPLHALLVALTCIRSITQCVLLVLRDSVRGVGIGAAGLTHSERVQRISERLAVHLERFRCSGVGEGDVEHFAAVLARGGADEWFEGL